MTKINVQDNIFASNALLKKLRESLTPGFIVDCDPNEAIEAGAFLEDAISHDDAYESSSDRDASDFDPLSEANHG